MLVPLDQAKEITASLRGLTGKLAKIMPSLHRDLAEAELKVKPDEYIGASILSATVMAVFITVLMIVLLIAVKAELQKAITMSAMSGTMVFMLFFMVLLIYPSVLSGKKAELMERDLIYALKDMLLEVSSGASIYLALNGVANSGYGEVSKEFKKIVGDSNVGIPVEDAMEQLALKTKSEHLRNSLWQIVNSMRSGSSIEGILRELTRDLTQERKNKIRSYAQELNIMILMYLLFAVVVPTIATTLIIVLGPFLGVSVGDKAFLIILPVCFFIQLSLMEFIKSRRPVVYI